MKEIYLAGGCFWGMQAYFEQLQGIVATEVGYANGHVENPTYEMVCAWYCTGMEAPTIFQYDASVITLRFLLSLYYDVIDRPAIIVREMISGNNIEQVFTMWMKQISRLSRLPCRSWQNVMRNRLL